MQGLPFNNWALPDLGDGSKSERDASKSLRYVWGAPRPWDTSSGDATAAVTAILFAIGFALGAFLNIRFLYWLRFRYNWARLVAVYLMHWFALVTPFAFSIEYKVSRFSPAVALSAGLIVWALPGGRDYLLVAAVFSGSAAALITLGSWLGSLIRRIRRRGEMTRAELRLAERDEEHED